MKKIIIAYKINNKTTINAITSGHLLLLFPLSELPPEFLSPLKNWSNMIKSSNGSPVIVVDLVSH